MILVSRHRFLGSKFPFSIVPFIPNISGVGIKKTMGSLNWWDGGKEGWITFSCRGMV